MRTPQEYHVSPSGSDLAAGQQETPFRTISHAARIARAGDQVIVHEGVYREWVRPAFGGDNPQSRVSYEAAPGEHAVIKGSEPVDGWEKTGDGLWAVELPDRFFGLFNPFRERIRGDWFDHENCIHHLGEVYCDGDILYEVQDRNELIATSMKWRVEHFDGRIRIEANFGKADPNEALVEVNVRPACFFPEHTGMDFIRVAGFEMCHAATQWAAHTSFHPGLLGPHWSKGWLIEDNHIHHSKCNGISLGKDRGTGQDTGSDSEVREPFLGAVEVIFNTLRKGWSRENIGSHIVRNNVIHDCGATGICGNFGGAFSEIYDNHIYRISLPECGIYGSERAGIKLHAAIDTVIKHNLIHDAWRGIWLDWQAQGTRISECCLFNNSDIDIFIEVSHGPTLLDHNICFSENSLKISSDGCALAHNLIVGQLHLFPIYNRWTHYHLPHSTQVRGLHIIRSGDHQFYNNLFLPVEEKQFEADLEKFMEENGLTEQPDFRIGHGLNCLDDYPTALTLETRRDRRSFLPIRASNNAYALGARPYCQEEDPAVATGWDAKPRLEADGTTITITFDLPKELADAKGPQVTSDLLGIVMLPEVRFELSDGRPYALGHPGENAVGPFGKLQSGENQVTWNLS